MNPLALVESPVAAAPARNPLGSGSYQASYQASSNYQTSSNPLAAINPLAPVDQV
jgi:hypothetical protein